MTTKEMKAEIKRVNAEAKRVEAETARLEAEISETIDWMLAERMLVQDTDGLIHLAPETVN